jgi:hypothetical protein
MTKPPGAPLEASIESTLHSHVITFAAEEARRTAQVITLDQFERDHRRVA